VAHDVVVEHGDVAAGGLQAGVAEQGGADVDRQAVVDQLGGEDASEVVWGEPDPDELRMRGAQVGVVGPADSGQLLWVLITLRSAH
jgi:hypothetical protein